MKAPLRRLGYQAKPCRKRKRSLRLLRFFSNQVTRGQNSQRSVGMCWVVPSNLCLDKQSDFGRPIVKPVSQLRSQDGREIVKLGRRYPRLAACIWDFFRSLALVGGEVALALPYT